MRARALRYKLHSPQVAEHHARVAFRLETIYHFTSLISLALNARLHGVCVRVCVRGARALSWHILCVRMRATQAAQH